MRAVIREEIEKAFDEGEINFYLIADAVQSAPNIDMLFFAYDSFKKAEHVEAPGRDIARLSLAEHFFFLGNALYEQKKFEDSIKKYSISLELNEDAGAYNNRGNAYVRLGEHERAIKDYDKAIELNPDYAKAYYNRGLAYAEQQKYNEAIKDYNKAIKLNPDYAEVYNNRGIVYAILGEHDKAREDILRAGNLFTNKQRIEDAIRVCAGIFILGEESERVIAGHILLLLSYISGSNSANDIKEILNEMGYMDKEVLRNAIERLNRREESKWLILIFSELLRVLYNRMRERRENHH